MRIATLILTHNVSSLLKRAKTEKLRDLMNLLFRIVSLNEGPISLKPQSSDPRCNSITDDDGAFDLAGQDESDTI